MEGVEILRAYGSRDIESCAFAVVAVFFVGLLGYGVSGIREVFKSCGKISKMIVVPVSVLYIALVGFVVFETVDSFYPKQIKYVVYVDDDVPINEFYQNYEVVEAVGDQGYVVIQNEIAE